MDGHRQDVEPETKQMLVLVRNVEVPERKNEELAAQTVAPKTQENRGVTAESMAVKNLAAQVTHLKKQLRQTAAEHQVRTERDSGQSSEVHKDLKQQLFEATSELWRSREEKESLRWQLHSTTSQLGQIRKEMMEMRTRSPEQVSQREAEPVLLRTQLNSITSQLSLAREKVHSMRRATEPRGSREAQLEPEDLKGTVRGKDEVISALRADLERREEEWKERYEELRRSCRDKMAAAQDESERREFRLDQDVQRLFLENKELQKLASTSKAYRDILKQEQKELRRKKKWEKKWILEKEKKQRKELEEKMKWEKELEAEREKRERRALREHERRETRDKEQREGKKVGFASFFYKWRNST